MILWSEHVGGYRMTARRLEEACALVVLSLFFVALGLLPLWRQPDSEGRRQSAWILGGCAGAGFVLAWWMARKSWWIDIPPGGRNASWGGTGQPPTSPAPVERFDVERQRERVGRLSYHLVAVLTDGSRQKPLGRCRYSAPQVLSSTVRQLNELLGVDPSTVRLDLPELVLSHRRESRKSCLAVLILVLALIFLLGIVAAVGAGRGL